MMRNEETKCWRERGGGDKGGGDTGGGRGG